MVGMRSRRCDTVGAWADRNQARFWRGLQLIDSDDHESKIAALKGLTPLAGMTSVPGGDAMDAQHALYWIELMQAFPGEVLRHHGRHVRQVPFDVLIPTNKLLNSATARNRDAVTEAAVAFKQRDATTLGKIRSGMSGLETLRKGSGFPPEYWYKQVIDAYKDLFEYRPLLELMASLVLIDQGHPYHADPFKVHLLMVDGQRVHKGKSFSKGRAARWLTDNAPTEELRRLLSTAYVVRFRNLSAHSDYLADPANGLYISEEFEDAAFSEVMESLVGLKLMYEAAQILNNVHLFEISDNYKMSDMGHLDWGFDAENNRLCLLQHAANFDGTVPRSVRFWGGPVGPGGFGVGSRDRLTISFNNCIMPQYDLGVHASPDSLTMLRNLSQRSQVDVEVTAIAPLMQPFDSIADGIVWVDGSPMLPIQIANGSAEVDTQSATKSLIVLEDVV